MTVVLQTPQSISQISLAELVHTYNFDRLLAKIDSVDACIQRAEYLSDRTNACKESRKSSNGPSFADIGVTRLFSLAELYAQRTNVPLTPEQIGKIEDINNARIIPDIKVANRRIGKLNKIKNQGHTFFVEDGRFLNPITLKDVEGAIQYAWYPLTEAHDKIEKKFRKPFETKALVQFQDSRESFFISALNCVSLILSAGYLQPALSYLDRLIARDAALNSANISIASLLNPKAFFEHVPGKAFGRRLSADFARQSIARAIEVGNSNPQSKKFYIESAKKDLDRAQQRSAAIPK
jgi:hypothetical protein